MEISLIVIIIIVVIFLRLSIHEQNTGSAGEKYTFREIKNIFGEHHIFRNIYISKANGQITEIDLLAIHKSGIYVFESKNYSGWIFGNNKQKYWTQSLKGGLKYQFYNPVWQNNTHIKAIQHNLKKYSNIMYYSYIVFSERCTLKIPTCNQANVYILNRDNLRYSLQQTISNSKQSLSDSDIETITAFFVSIQNPGKTVKHQHLVDVQKAIMSSSRFNRH